jgi:LysM repeat protein
LAPLALVATAIALFVVVSSGGDGAAGDQAATPTATASPRSAKAARKAAKPKTYTVRPGDTPSGIAARLHISVGDLLDANPRADPNALSPGQKLKLP